MRTNLKGTSSSLFERKTGTYSTPCAIEENAYIAAAQYFGPIGRGEDV